MTNEEAHALYDRAVAAGFRLEPGCRVWLMGELDTVAWVGERPSHPWLGQHIETHLFEMMPAADVWCDFREAASLGCLLKQVRAAWGDPYAMPDAPGSDGCADWGIKARGVWVVDSCTTEADALVTALEAAPKVRP